jgi:hypothetical protein
MNPLWIENVWELSKNCLQNVNPENPFKKILLIVVRIKKAVPNPC